MLTLERGVAVVDALPSMVAAWGAEGFGKLLTFKVAGRMQNRARSRDVLLIVEAAKQQKASTGQPFWDALFDQLPMAPASLIEEVLSLAQFHLAMEGAATTDNYRLSSSAVQEAIEAKESELGVGEILAVSSRLWLDSGEERHIPMLDFRVAISAEHEKLIRQQLHVLGAKGWIFESGRSYHFIGRDLLAGESGLREFLGRSLLFAPVVDGRWVAHQLIEGACALRISSGNAGQIRPRLTIAID